MLGGIEELLGREWRIDNDRLARRLTADQIRRAPEIVVDELPKEHRSGR